MLFLLLSSLFSQQGLEIKSGLCAAVIDDYARRSKVYISDFTDG